MTTMRMTVEEMEKTYPNSCIGITDVEFDEYKHIVAGDVKYTDKTPEELVSMSIRHTGIRPFYTSRSDGAPTLGALML